MVKNTFDLDTSFSNLFWLNYFPCEKCRPMYAAKYCGLKNLMVFYDDEVCGFQLVFLLTNCISVDARIVNNRTTVCVSQHRRDCCMASEAALALAFQATDAILKGNILVNQVALYENALRAIAKNARHCFPPSGEQSKRRGLVLATLNQVGFLIFQA